MKTKVKNETKDEEKDQLDEFHTAFLSFDLNTREFLYCLHSTCGCCDSRHVCSHLAGFSFFIRCAQRCNFNRDMFENALPVNPMKLQNTLTLIENVCSNDNRKKVAIKREEDLKALLNCNDVL